MAKLKPCPFCGGEARIIEHEFTGADNTYGIKCKCGTQGFQFWESIDDAIKAWNRRAQDVVMVWDQESREDEAQI